MPSDLDLSHRTRATNRLTLLVLVCCVLNVLSLVTVPDPDMFHEMALFRAALQTGHLPRTDLFAYTPTIPLIVHHEWGTGAILYAIITGTGGSGLLILRYLLAAATVAIIFWTGRRRGASWATLGVLAPVALFLLTLGCSPIRAQLFTLLFTAALLHLLDRDRVGLRWWIVAWIPIHIIWANLHAGFVVGLGLITLHWLEQVVRTRRGHWHLPLGLLAMVFATLLNPYGWDYIPYLFRALLMARPHIPEWAPIYTNPLLGPLYAVTVAVFAYAAWRSGPRRLTGLAIILAGAWMALRHTRHASLWAVIWLSYVLPAVEPTPLGQTAARWWRERTGAVRVALVLFGLLNLSCAIYREPWHLSIPVTAADAQAGAAVVYPVGAVAYLQDQHFQGNVMTPFVVGAYVSWKLSPAVKVSMDGRYEVAYVPSVLDDVLNIYDAKAGWEQLLARYPTDLILLPADSPLASRLAKSSAWTRIYRDEVYLIYARAGLSLPAVERPEPPTAAHFFD